MLGVITFLKRREFIHLIWSFFIFCVSVWGFGVFLIGLSGDENISIVIWRLAYIGVILIPVLWLHFVLLLIDLKKKILLIFIYSITFLFLLVNLLTVFFIKDVYFAFDQFYYLKPTVLYDFFVAFFFAVIVYALVLLYLKHKKSSGQTRVQIKIVLATSCVGFGGGSTAFLPVYGIDYYPVFNFTIATVPFIVAYAMSRHRLMDIKLVLRSSSVSIFSFSTVIAIAFGFKYFFDLFFPENICTWCDFFILAIAVYLFPFIKTFYYRFANKYLFTSLYDSEEVLEETTNHLKSILDINKIYRTVSDIIIRSFHSKSIGILTYSDITSYSIRYSKGIKAEQDEKFFRNEDFRSYISENGGVVILSEMEQIDKQAYHENLNILKRFKIEIVSALTMKGKNIGYIILGPKESGDSYNDEDLRVLRIISSQMAVIMDNALMYDKVRNFNIKLEHEVEKATRDMRKANAKLKKLDQAKSEFISIASHQLRTPLTVIKGYISMMLEGNFGKINNKIKDPLEKVYASNERLINLVEGLLGVSRIESGRLPYDFKKEYLENIVVSVVDELNESALKKNLILLYDAPNKSFPLVKIDQEKIRQVILNLIDNAIKYTNEGIVKVTLDNLGTKVRFCVFDSGMGISEDDFGNLFKKFSRGQGVSILNTEGTGLGLYVAKEVIKAHGGKIWAESWGEGQGSKFCFEIPVAKK